MLALSQIQANSQGIDHLHAKSVETERHVGVWDGFVYDSNGHAEQAAVAGALSALAAGVPATRVAEQLRGSYFLVVHDRLFNRTLAWVDDSALFSAYRGTTTVARSFAQLFHHQGLGSADLNPGLLVEFLQMGYVGARETLTSSIKKIDYDELIVMENGELRVEHKPAAALFDPPSCHSLQDAIEPLAEAIRDRLVSVDLTGGFDSRLLACLIKQHNLPFEAALSGFAGHIDQQLGQQVATALGVPYHFSVYDPSSIVDDINDLLERADGLCGNLATCHRLLHLCEDRHSRGVELSLKGQGGEMFKDFFWSQDLPFYRRHSSNLKRLHRLRMEMELLSGDVLTKDYHEHFRISREHRVNRLGDYVRPLNTQTYDHIYFRERIQCWNGRTISSSQFAHCPTHSPLCESALVRIGYVQPRRKRFYSRFHREHITRISPAAARVRTTDGTSADSHLLAMLGDCLGYAAVKSGKLKNKITQVVTNRSSGSVGATPVNLNATDLLCQSLPGQLALDALKHHSVVRDSVGYEQISPRFRCHFLTLGHFLAEATLQQQAPTHRPLAELAGTGI